MLLRAGLGAVALTGVGVIACGAEPPPLPQTSGTSTADTMSPATSEATSSSTTTETPGTTTETSGTTTGGDSQGLELPPGCECLEDFGCACFDVFSACYDLREPCEAPSPCPEVDEENPKATTCVLELLRDRTFSRFSYCHLCGGYEKYDGHFYILGADAGGIDFECHTIDFSAADTIQYYGIETPDYFATCLAMEDFALQRDCLFGGFEPREPVEFCQ
jgi:hypothetical protein